MKNEHKELLSMGLTIAVVISALFIIHRFIPSLVWAVLIATATYPLYQRFRTLFRQKNNLAALLFTLVLGLLLIVPLTWLVTVLLQELQFFFNYLQTINRVGGQVPSYLRDLPMVGHDIETYWDNNFGQPGALRHFLSNLHLSLSSFSYYLKQVGFALVHRSVQFGFTLLCLFFFYRDGDKVLVQMNHIGQHCLGSRWSRYADKLPMALRATINGTILVGASVGVLMGFCYWLVSFPAPTLFGFITAFAAMIPFVVPIVFLLVSLVLFSNGYLLAALIVIAWGTLVMFVADHFVKPVLIGGAIQLPFLAVLFGILGGVETLGLLGLFLGPIIMVLFITLWNESQGQKS